MAPWWKGRLCAFDTETTGPDPMTARIVSAAVSFVGGDEPVRSMSWLVNPGCEIPVEAAAIHGITTTRAVAEGRDSTMCCIEIANGITDGWKSGAPLVAFNAAYDLTVLAQELARHGLPPLNLGAVVDPFVLDSALDRYRKGKRTLTATCEHYRVGLDKAHDAAADAIAAARLAYRIGSTTEVGGFSLEQLHEWQMLRYAERAASLEAHFRKTKPGAVVSREWPVRRAA